MTGLAGIVRWSPQLRGIADLRPAAPGLAELRARFASEKEWSITSTELKGLDLDSWFALYAPAGTPSEVVQLLNTEVGRILNGPDARKRADESGTAVLTMSPQELAQFTKSELERWGRVISSAKITVE